jgi:hypothetical protein
MLQAIFHIELKKALTNKMALAAFAMVLSLSLFHGVTAIVSYQAFYSDYILKAGTENLMITSESLFHRWIASDVSSFPTSAFYFMLPLMAALPYGWSLASEMQSGYIKNMMVRTTRRNYFISKYGANFISASLITMIPLALNFAMLALFLPALKMESIYPYGTIGQGCMWAALYYERPFVYCLLYLLLDGIFAGLISSIGTAAAFVVKSKAVVIALPFILMLIFDYIDANYWLNGEYSPMKFLQALPISNDCYGWAVTAIGMMLFISTFGFLLYKGHRYEVL